MTTKILAVVDTEMMASLAFVSVVTGRAGHDVTISLSGRDDSIAFVDPLQLHFVTAGAADLYRELGVALGAIRVGESVKLLAAPLRACESDLRAAIDERDRAQAALAAEREVSDGRQQRIAELEDLASLAACAIDCRLTVERGAPDIRMLDEALAAVSQSAKTALGADPHVDARDQPELMRRSEVKA